MITGLETGIDKIWLDWLSGMDASRFVASAAEMTDNGAWIIHEQSTGRLWVDTNGTDMGERTLMARFLDTPTIAFTDFLF